jgi:endonuclease/exonuclease/phosphatase family metal-dependent hydrolase
MPLTLITWNTQWCRGVDGRVDPERIVRDARSLANFDVLCLQEIAVNFRGLAGSSGEDQFTRLAAALPGFRGIFGIATDQDDGDGGRRSFGNAIFSRPHIHQAFRHLLPWPADPTVPSMQRGALEVVIEASFGPLRVTTTHLEYYSAPQRAAQVEALRRLHGEACGQARTPRLPGDRGEPFAFTPRPAAAIVCGDFNFPPEDPLRARLQDPMEVGTPRLVDAWPLVHGTAPHALTVGVHDRRWPLTTWDYVFVSEDVAPRVHRIETDSTTTASDHQPLMMVMD